MTNKIRGKHLAVSFAILAFVFGSNSLASAGDEAADKGLKIATEMDHRDDGWQNVTADLSMILFNQQGETVSRQIRTKALEVSEDGDKSLLIFDSPADVKDTVFLNVAHKLADDDQWIYLPALKRVKRIASSTKGGSFMGSEFSYEDMSFPILEKYDYKYVKDEAVQGRSSFVVERIPKDTNSLYSKHVLWVDQEHYIPWQVQYFDKSGGLLKTLTLRKYKRYLDKFWRAAELEMVNHNTGKKTILKSDNLVFRTDNVSAKDFNPEGIGSAR